jgi:hypothetical protein
MNPIRHIRRPAAVLAATVLVAFGATAAVAAIPVPYPGDESVGPVSNTPQIQVPAIVAGGMPGWQIALIAVGAAILAAAVAVLADRAFAARRRAATAAA